MCCVEYNSFFNWVDVVVSIMDEATFNRVWGRVKDVDLPESPLELQRLVRGNSGIEDVEGLGGKVSEYTDMGFENLNPLLEDYCSSCRAEESCDWNYQIRGAAGNGYCFWSPAWNRVEFFTGGNRGPLPNASVTMCSHYQSEKLEKKGVDALRQPLVRLVEVIDLKKGG